MSASSDRPNIVKSIFDRKPQKPHAGLFQSSPVPAVVPEEKKKRSSKKISKKLPFGLEIGTSALKVMWLEKTPQGLPRIAGQEIVEFPREIQAERSRARQDLIKPILRSVIEKNDFPLECYVAAPWALLKTHFIKLPRLSSEEVEDALRLEVRRQHQLSFDEISFDSVSLKHQQKYFGDQSGTLLVSVPKKPIFEYLSLFEDLSIYPAAIETESLAQVAALNYFKMLDPEGAVLLVDIGAGKTTLNVISNQELLFVRMVASNGMILTETIAENCHVSWPAAEAMKRSFVPRGPEGEQGPEGVQQRDRAVQETLTSFKEHLTQDIEHTFKYFAFEIMHSDNLQFQKIILSGGGSLLPNLAGSLREHFKVPVEFFASGLSSDGQRPGEMKKEEWDVRTATVLGLALRGFET